MNHHRRTGLVLALVVTLTLACSLLSGAMSGTSETSGASTSSEEVSTGTGGTTEEEPDMIDLTLGLRSVRLSLSAEYPDGYTRSLIAEVDAAGNSHLAEPFIPEPDLQATLTPPEGGWGEFELFVVGGHAYPRMSGEAAAQDDTYLTFLEDELRSPDGPGLWLVWAGTEDLEPIAHEDVGGFAAIRYPVDATLDEGTIQGTIWVDEETSALVRVELTISPTLFSPADNPASGDLSILFEVTQAEISPISVP
jgi:hypothetical protein